MSFEEFESLAVIAGALITAIFSFLIWRANKESAKAAQGAADAAKESARISELMLNASEKQNGDMRDQLKRDILNICDDIFKVLKVMISDGVTSERMNSLPDKISITNNELANYFTKEERTLIFYTVKEYETFRENYFKNGQAKYTSGEKLTKDCTDLSDRIFDVIIEFTDQIVISSEVTIS